MLAFFDSLKQAEFGFSTIWEAIRTLYHDIAANSDVLSIWNAILENIAPVYATVMTLAVVFFVFVALYGRKMMGVLKFIFFFICGFGLGIHLLAPIIPETVIIPPWIIGLVTALVAAVLYRFLYVILFTVAIGYSTYVLIYNGFYLQTNPIYTPTKAFTCLVIAFAVVLVAFLFKKYVEIVGTAFIGGWCASWIFANKIYAFTSAPVFSGIEWLGILIPALIIGGIGVVVQIRTRYRY